MASSNDDPESIYQMPMTALTDSLYADDNTSLFAETTSGDGAPSPSFMTQLMGGASAFGDNSAFDSSFGSYGMYGLGHGVHPTDSELHDPVLRPRKRPRREIMSPEEVADLDDRGDHVSPHVSPHVAPHNHVSSEFPDRGVIRTSVVASGPTLTEADSLVVTPGADEESANHSDLRPEGSGATATEQQHDDGDVDPESPFQVGSLVVSDWPDGNQYYGVVRRVQHQNNRALIYWLLNDTHLSQTEKDWANLDTLRPSSAEQIADLLFDMNRRRTRKKKNSSRCIPTFKRALVARLNHWRQADTDVLYPQDDIVMSSYQKFVVCQDIHASATHCLVRTLSHTGVLGEQEVVEVRKLNEGRMPHTSMR
ncbi:MAG: hypothetical protein MHM6MM_003749 [Cercozoa sp. M6MM]